MWVARRRYRREGRRKDVLLIEENASRLLPILPIVDVLYDYLGTL